MARPPSLIPEIPPDIYGLEALGWRAEDLISGNRLVDQINIESLCYRIGHTRGEGGLGKFGHFKNYVDLTINNPDLDCRKRFVWNSWSEKMLREACDWNELGVAGCTSAGKCCAPETLVRMFDGSVKRFDEVQAGDQVMGDDSTPRTVLEVHRGRGEMYKITPAQGDSWTCTGNHKLVLKRAFAPKKSWRRVGDIVEIEVQDFAKASIQFKRQHKQFCVGVDYAEQDVWLDPRILGIWLGDGHIHNSRICIPYHEIEVRNYVRDWAEVNGYHFNQPKSGDPACPNYQIFENKEIKTRKNPFFQFVKSCLEEGEKRIPSNYLVNSRKVRMELLAGLLDTDGHAAGTYFEFTTKYGGLKDDVVSLARSLGFRVSEKKRKTSCDGKEFDSWRVTICGDTCAIPTLRKKCVEKTLRTDSSITSISVEKSGEGDWVGFSVDGNHRFLLGDYTVTHNSDPFALWAVMNYLMDPTHTLVLVMSTTLQGAKKRIWKTLKEYWNALPDLPGKPLWSTNEIRGLSYEGDDYGDSSGIFLLASEQSNEKTALDKLIGIKAPRTGQPDDSFESMWIDPEFTELKKVLSREHLEDLLPRLRNISKDRIGKLILIIDEATGCAESILNVIQTNLKPGNTGHFQVIMLGNPNSHWDTFGLFCTPVDGWQNVTLADEEWETTTGGLCIRFNGEKNPRIVDKNEKFSWMLRQEDISRMEETYGRDSLYFYRMCLGMWSPEGTDSGIYSQADLESNDAMKFAVWGFDKPTVLSALDPSFTNGGDRASCTFAHYGIDSTGKQVLELVEEIPIKVDINDTRVPVSYQMVRNWRRECEKRGCEAKNACFDSTGGGVTFADIVRTQWSALVQAISSAGKASKTPVGNERGADGKKMLCSERYANKATEIWYGMHPFLRSGQIRGLTTSLAKQICSRQHDKSGRGDGRVLQTESKRVFKAREGNSPDESDSWLLLVEHAKTRHGFKPSERAAVSEGEKSQGHGVSSWAAFVQKARRITNVKKLK